MYKNILVPVTFGEDRDSKSALDVAELLADDGADITLLHVIEQIPTHTLSYLPPDHMAKRRAEVEAELEEMAKSVKGGMGAVASGHSGRAILDYIAEHKNDCVVIASHRPGMQDLLLGSTAAKVVRHAPCCVHVVR